MGMEAHIINSRKRTSKHYKSNPDIKEGSVVAFQVTSNAFHPTYCKWRFGRIVKFSPEGIDGAPRSADILYLSFPGDPESGKKLIERTMKRRLDTHIPVGDM